mgnify:CR=1 FL=1
MSDETTPVAGVHAETKLDAEGRLEEISIVKNTGEDPLMEQTNVVIPVATEPEEKTPGPFDHLTYTAPDKDGKLVVKKLMDAVTEKDIWSINNGRTHILSLRGFQKLAEFEHVVEKKFETVITPTADNKQQHAVNVWLGFAGETNPDNWRRGSGEASVLNTGKVSVVNGKRTYVEIGEIDACYRYALADKRGYCRAMQKLLNLQGVYADVEAASFKKNAQSSTESSDTDFDF